MFTDEEAIPERDPSYELPGDFEVGDTTEMMSAKDAAFWDHMLKQRPWLRYIHGRFLRSPAA